MVDEQCILCGSSPSPHSDGRDSDELSISCRGCGQYYVERDWCVDSDGAAKLTERQRRQLCGVVRADTDGHRRSNEMIGHDTWRQVIARHNEPRTPLEQLHRVITVVANRAPFVGARSAIDDAPAMARRVYLPMGQDFDELRHVLQRMGFLERVDGWMLTLEGWRLADELSRDAIAEGSAFVAMWFDSGLDAAFTTGFAPALSACGFMPRRIDRHPHNNKIDDEIIATIRKSALVVADLTGCRPNVFYEAGFAYGLGRQVLYTCHESYRGHYLPCAPDSAAAPAAVSATWAEQVEKHAFDVRQYLVMRWADAADLAKKLEDRIRALGLNVDRRRKA